MPLDFAAAIWESDAAGVDVVDAFFIEPPAEDELALEVAGAAGELAAGAEFGIAAAALGFAPDDLLLAAAFELSAAAAPESATVDFSVVFFLLLLVPVVLVPAESLDGSAEAAAVVSAFLLFLLLLVSVVVLLAGAPDASPEDAALTSDFLLFLPLLFEELLLAVSELAELSDAEVSDFDFELFLEEAEEEFVLLVSLSEPAFFLDFLLLVEAVPWSVDVPDGVCWDWAKATGRNNMDKRHIAPAKTVNFQEKKRLIDMRPTFRSTRLQPANSEALTRPLRDPEVRNSSYPIRSQKSSSPPPSLSTVRRT